VLICVLYRRTWERTKGPKKFWTWIWGIVQFEPNHIERKTGVLGYPPRFSKIPPQADRTASYFEDSNDLNISVSSDAKQPLPSGRPYHNMEGLEEPIVCTFARRIVFQLCDVQIITGLAVLVAALAQESHLTYYHAQLAQNFWWVTLDSLWISRIDYSRCDAPMQTWRAALRRSAIWLSTALSIVIQVLVAIREKYHW
jgi:hypothetical protein